MEAYKLKNGSYDFYWEELFLNCQRLEKQMKLETDRKHNLAIKLKDFYNNCDPNRKLIGQRNWNSIAKFIKCSVTPCPKCYSLVTDQKLQPHKRKDDCYKKGVEKYTYLSVDKFYVCFVCLEEFSHVSKLQEHMS